MPNQEMEPLPVAVIVPIYNAAATIGACLASIAAQTWRPAEVIVVDDASTDGSAELARHAGVARLTVLHHSVNRGPGAARNTAAHHASAEWLAFLDADNFWEPAFLERMVGAASELGADFAGSGGMLYRSYPRRMTSRRLLPGARGPADRTSDFWRISLRFVPVVPSSSLVRRACFNRAGGFPEDMRNGEDITLFARLWVDGRFVFVNEPLYTSVQQSTSLTASGPSYHDVWRMIARVGRCLLRSLRRRKKGSGWFVLALARMAAGRHVAWLRARPRRPHS